jgi:hypothetical protein
MRVIITISIIIFCWFPSDSQQNEPPLDFRIYFGNYFYGDTVAVKLQGITIVKNKVLKSATNGATGFTITQYKNKIEVSQGGQSLINLRKVPIQPYLKVDIYFRGIWYSYKFDIKKGKVLFVQNNIPENAVNRSVFRIEQSDNVPIFL